MLQKVKDCMGSTGVTQGLPLLIPNVSPLALMSQVTTMLNSESPQLGDYQLMILLYTAGCCYVDNPDYLPSPFTFQYVEGEL
jgi:hypothetical protein